MAQRTLIVGLGITGLSCIRHLAGRDELTVLDTRERPPGLAQARALQQYPFFEGKELKDQTCVYVCRDSACSPPLTALHDVEAVL